ncbi:hypothetical protein [Providencia alcalifaciens]|uniref:hypothetical protein n=1 Tax=Providencia alcalifaciens TaxID=126385 RepID=UPI0004521F75|nr:hypothetical protein [Providencia alcalifaciens]EUD08293.1 hypothetical protein HMPREF1564_1651 [Providencia alcalifaciens R90-1475]CAG9437053.1 hypothetical protein NVI2019_ANGEOOBF_04146 [Providencia alcalifaciens]CAG9437131.1 hypothetical protein NVI2019_OGMBKCAO_04168 [Providencia alcalifaciens]CAG9437150.1 hypothetical protein NVI2019_PLFLNFOB_04157 [Providencia alcalifaciens]CAG9437229.1 hypothetical protein NVI2019_KOLGMIGM_04184 [Providencia alcalifaciens]
MKRHQKIRHSRLFQVNAHGYVTESLTLTHILDDVRYYFPVIKRIIWASYRADNEIHELVIDYQKGRFVLTMECGLGPTVFTSITEEDIALNHKQVEFVDSVDIFHFIRCLVELHQLQKIHIEDEKMIYSS